MKSRKLHYAWIIVFVTFLAFLAVQGEGLHLGRLWNRGKGTYPLTEERPLSFQH